ncbi:MAG TPA: metallophosphoesterase [Anaerolineae bacterium]|nr:metallophosphoesterase [Anaerolineae bacterium]
MSLNVLIPYHIANLALVGALLLMLRPNAAAAPTRRTFYVFIALGAAIVILIIAAGALHIDPYEAAQLPVASLLGYGTLLFGGLAALYRRTRWIMGSCILMVFVLLAIAVDAFLIEPHWLEVTTVTLRSPKVMEPLRIAVLADIQTDRAGAYEARVMAEVLRAQPDLILFAGDYLHLSRRSRGYAAEMGALNEVLTDAGLSAPLGMIAVMGNMDRHYDWPQLFAGLPLTRAQTTTRYDLGPVALTALGMRESFNADIRVPPADDFHIVLGHSPNFALGDVDADLLLAGHTHGGQIPAFLRAPVMLLVGFPRISAAHIAEIAPGKTLIISRGIGMERGAAPQMRFLCRPELVIVDVLPQ